MQVEESVKASSSSAFTSEQKVDGEVVASTEQADTSRQELARTAVGQAGQVKLLQEGKTVLVISQLCRGTVSSVALLHEILGELEVLTYFLNLR